MSFIIKSDQHDVPYEPTPLDLAIERYYAATDAAQEVFDAATQKGFNAAAQEVFDAAVEAAWTNNPLLAEKLGNLSDRGDRERFIKYVDLASYNKIDRISGEKEAQRAAEEQRIIEDLEQQQ